MMSRKFDISDNRADIRSDVKNGGSGRHADYGGELAKNDGIDLNPHGEGIKIGESLGEHSGRRIFDVEPSSYANARHGVEHGKKNMQKPIEKREVFHPPYPQEPGSMVFKYELDKDMNQAQIHSGEKTNSKWSTPPKDAQNKGVAELKDELAIPGNPDKVTETTYEKDSVFEYGQAAGHREWGKGGGRQSYHIGKQSGDSQVEDELASTESPEDCDISEDGQKKADRANVVDESQADSQSESTEPLDNIPIEEELESPILDDGEPMQDGLDDASPVEEVEPATKDEQPVDLNSAPEPTVDMPVDDGPVEVD